MKLKVLSVLLCIFVSAAVFTGCGSNKETVQTEISSESDTSDDTSDISSTDESDTSKETEPADTPSGDSSASDTEDGLPDYLQDDSDISENQIDTTLAEGFNAAEGTKVTIPADAEKINAGAFFCVPSDGNDYEIQINSIEETDERNPYAASEASKVLVISYTVKNNNIDEGVLVDNYSFKLLNEDNETCEYYPLDTEGSNASVSIAEKGKTAECSIAYAVNDDSRKFTLLFEDIFCGTDTSAYLESELTN